MAPASHRPATPPPHSFFTVTSPSNRQSRTTARRVAYTSLISFRSPRSKVASGSFPSSVETVPTMPPTLESPSTVPDTVQPFTRPGPWSISSVRSVTVSSGSFPSPEMA